MKDFARFISACRANGVARILIESEPCGLETKHPPRSYRSDVDEPSIFRVERDCLERSGECNTFFRLNGTRSPWSPGKEAYIWALKLRVGSEGEKYRVIAESPLRPAVSLSTGDLLTMLWFSASESTVANYFLVQTVLASYYSEFAQTVDVYTRIPAPGFPFHEVLEPYGHHRQEATTVLLIDSEAAYKVETMIGAFGRGQLFRSKGPSLNDARMQIILDPDVAFQLRETLHGEDRSAGLLNVAHAWRAALLSPLLLYSALDYYNRRHSEPSLNALEVAEVVGKFFNISAADVIAEISSGNIPVYNYPHAVVDEVFKDLDHA